MLEEYYRKRDLAKSPEPAGNIEEQTKDNNKDALRFVVQKHDASRLHYDFRLESKNEGVLKSWAVPKGISLDPNIKRLAILTEDHPIDYLLFEGIIPKGNYGAGTVIVWDTGTYIIEDQDIHNQFIKGKIVFSLSGHKLKGKFSLVKTSKENQWLLIKVNDEFVSKEDLSVSKPDSVLSGRNNNELQEASNKARNNNKSSVLEDTTRKKKSIDIDYPEGVIQKFPTSMVKPMLSTQVDKPFDNKDWVFEVKWDGVRCIFFLHHTKGLSKLQSRNGKTITHRYPELLIPLQSNIKCKECVILDGEIVVLDKEGFPDFQHHQKRMNIDYNREIEFLSKQFPATYYVFDILYLDGNNLQNLELLERRRILTNIVNTNSKIKISDFIEEYGIEVFREATRMNLEGIVAKRKTSRYFQGIRSKDWLKIKSIKTQDCIIIGYTKGEGNREKYFGSLLLAVVNNSDGKLRFVGHTGSGFNLNQLKEIYNELQKIRIEKCPVEYVPYTNREPVWVSPNLVVEVKFSEWTNEKIMRSPIFLRFREDKGPYDCIVERERHSNEIVQLTKKNYCGGGGGGGDNNRSAFSNLDKVFWNKTQEHPQFTKNDLIDYYDKIADWLLPYLKDRPLSLSRYPDGITGRSFYHKNWDNEKPEYVNSVQVYSKSKEAIINYLVCNNKDTLLWLANLGCIEMHPWYSRINDYNVCTDSNMLYEDKCGLNYPDFIVFDLDPYIYSGKEKKAQEPEYNVKAFKATVDVAYNLEELFNALNIRSYIKSSGKTGLHIFVPIINSYTFEQTKSFAEVIGKILKKRHPQKITMDWDISKRNGRVFFDHNQNAKGKTIASIFSIRPTTSATVSMPINWEELCDILPTDFTMLNVSEIVKKKGNPWKELLENRQDINKILQNVVEMSI
jgi:bifunctional non-homologous end joining protein LigD